MPAVSSGIVVLPSVAFPSAPAVATACVLSPPEAISLPYLTVPGPSVYNDPRGAPALPDQPSFSGGLLLPVAVSS